jgi:hypothetical protein
MAKIRCGELSAGEFTMSKAIKATRCDDEQPPRHVKAIDDDGGVSTYVRAGIAPQPEGAADFVYDEFHPERIDLGTKNGEILLQQPQAGLPSQAIMSVYPSLGGSLKCDAIGAFSTGFPGAWAGSQIRFYRMEKE